MSAEGGAEPKSDFLFQLTIWRDGSAYINGVEPGAASRVLRELADRIDSGRFAKVSTDEDEH